MKTETLDDNSYASDPGGIRLSHAKLRELHPELYRLSWLGKLTKKPSRMQRFLLTRMEEHLMYGDSRAALVVSLNPLLIAAYTDELDYCVVLKFPQSLIQQYQLALETRLLTVNLYGDLSQLARDLDNGPASYHRYTHFHPLIAEFLSEDTEEISRRKEEIEEAEWKRVREASQEYLTKNEQKCRNGMPLESQNPA